MRSIGDDVEHDDRRRREHQQRHQHGVVAAGQRFGEQAAEPGPREHAFGDDGAGHQQRRVEQHDGDDRQRARCAARAAGSRARPATPRARAASDERLRERLDHRAAQIARPGRGVHRGEHRRRQQQVLQAIEQRRRRRTSCGPTRAASRGRWRRRAAARRPNQNTGSEMPRERQRGRRRDRTSARA